MKLLFVLGFGLAAVTAVPYNTQRIVGGSVTNIEQYPYAAAILLSLTGTTFEQGCGATILNNRSVLSAAHCFPVMVWRIRVGSTYANSGGIVHNVQYVIGHPDFSINAFDAYDNDIAVVRSATAIIFSSNVRPGSIAGVNYNVPDNTPVWAIGWGETYYGGPWSEELRHVQVWTVNHDICTTRFAAIRLTVTANMLCSGWLDIGGRDQCRGDSGGPLIHNNVVIGVCSWGVSCAQPQFPGVNTRVSRFTPWILENA